MPKLGVLKNFTSLSLPLLAFIIGIIPQDAANPWMMLAFFILSLYLILSGRLSNLNLKDPILLLLLFLWLGWIWGGIFSSVPFASEVTLIILGSLPISYLCFVNRDITRLLQIICLIVTVLAAGAMLYMLLPVHHWRAKLFFDDENILGGLIAFVMPLTLSFYFFASDKKYKILIYLMLAVLTGGLIATQSRSAFIGGFIGIMAVILKNKVTISPRSLKLAIPIFAVTVTAFFLSSFGHRFLLILQGDKDVLGRFALWSSAFKMALINPVHGVGLGIFHLYYPLYKTLADNSAGFWVHMDPLQWAVETGWATALAFYALFGFVFFKFWKSDLTPLQTGCGASLLTIFLIAHAGYNFHYVPTGILTGLLLTQFSLSSLQSSKLRYVVAVSMTLVILCNLWSIMRTAPTLYFWTKAMEGSSTGNSAMMAQNFENCIENGDKRFPACRIEASRILLQVMAEPPEYIALWLREAESASPLSPEPDILMAQYHLKKDPENLSLPIEILKKALNKNPSIWQGRSLLVKLLMQQGKYQEAYDTLEEARKWQIDRGVLETYYKMEKDLYGILNK